MARSNNPRACALPGKMSTRSRDLLPDRAFGLPKERKYPLYRMARDGTLIPSGSHASNAKARAQQEYDKGNLSAAKLKQIDRKADKVLKECGVKGKKRKKNPMTKGEFEEYFKNEVLPAVIEQYEQDGVPDKPARREEWNNTVDAFVKDGLLSERAYDWSHPKWLETYVPRSNNPNRLTVTADSEEEAERKARKFGRVLHTERIGRDKFAVSVASRHGGGRRNNPEPTNVGALIGRLKF